MTLLDRLIGMETPKYSVHAFHAVCALYADGNATRVQARDYLNAATNTSLHLTSAEEAQWGSWLNEIDGQGTAAAKAMYVHRVHQYLILAEEGVLSKAEVKSLLNVPD